MPETPQKTLSKWIIWRRNDGHINASGDYLPANYVGGGPYREEPGVKTPRESVTFEKIGEADSWDSAADIIRRERVNAVDHFDLKDNGNQGS